MVQETVYIAPYVHNALINNPVLNTSCRNLLRAQDRQRPTLCEVSVTGACDSASPKCS